MLPSLVTFPCKKNASIRGEGLDGGSALDAATVVDKILASSIIF